MERIGEKLRKRREELGFTIDDIARSTNFRPELIRAVEGGRTAAFTADAYLNAFLRAYATKLDLDPREIILEQKSEEERIHDALSGMQLKSRKPAAIPKWLLLALVVAAVAVGLFIVYDRVFKDALSSGAGEPAASQAAGDRQVESGETTVGAQHQAGPGGDAAGPVAEESSGSESVGDAAAAAGEASGSENGQAQQDQAQQDQAPAVMPPKQQPDSLSISVSGWSTHIKLRSGDALLLDEMLNPGYSKTFYSRQPFWFDHITNKDAVSLLFNGRPVRLPNSSGSKLVSDLRVPPEGR
ncbi:MAG: helix-turn-helix transcriptional regulator [bacterium]